VLTATIAMLRLTVTSVSTSSQMSLAVAQCFT
jgi:hypothetical protein